MSQFMIFADNIVDYLHIMRFIIEAQAYDVDQCKELSVEILNVSVKDHKQPVIEVQCEESFFDELEQEATYKLIEII